MGWRMLGTRTPRTLSLLGWGWQGGVVPESWHWKPRFCPGPGSFLPQSHHRAQEFTSHDALLAARHFLWSPLLLLLTKWQATTVGSSWCALH